MERLATRVRVNSGCSVVINGLNPDRLVATAADIRSQTGALVTPVVTDINTEAGRATLAAAYPDADILVNNNEGPPPGKLADWSHDDWLGALEANMRSS
jgi:3-oxoacyl-[acyl-carrier protein] reductase